MWNMRRSSVLKSYGGIIAILSSGKVETCSICNDT